MKTGQLGNNKVQQMLQLVERRYPNWAGFSDPRFIEDELRYKKSAISETKRLLDENDLKDLLNRRQFEEYIERIEGAARAGKNLLYLATPTSGDISVLYEDKLDKEEFCKAFYDLLFGDGDSPERVGKFSDYLESCELPNRWTFATYFLYLLNPEHDLFVKPRTTTWFLQFTDANESLPSTPNQQDYELILSLSEQLKLALSAYGATDMVAVQSFMWVAKQVDTQPVISEVKLREFKRLYRLFYVDYLHTEKGEEHIENRHQSRVSAQENHKLILEAVKEGKDITDLVILKYLPYNNTKTHRDQGAWISIAPAITSDVRKWYEANKWTDPDDWPKVALAILDFVNNCLEHPDNLPEYCQEFSDLPFTTGFQTGMMTPILNALSPEHFLLINNKSRAVINYFAETDFEQVLTHYPAINSTGKSLVEYFENIILTISPDTEISADDIFDTFGHWLIAEVGYFQKPSDELNEIFATNREALWAFNIFEKAVEGLGISGVDDRLKSVTFYKKNNTYTIRLSYGNWLVLGFDGASGNIQKVFIALFENDIDPNPIMIGHFSQPEDEKKVLLFRLTYEDFIKNEEEILSVFIETMRFIHRRFSHWKATPYLDSQNAKMAEAVMDFEALKNILQKGIQVGETQRENNYWIIAPPGSFFNWDQWKTGVLAFYWEEIGDLSGLSEAEVQDFVWSEEIESKQAVDVESIYSFSNFKSGDAVILIDSDNVLGFGVVTENYAYKPSEEFKHQVVVQWENLEERKIKIDIREKFVMSLPEDEYNSIITTPPFDPIPIQPKYPLDKCAIDSNLNMDLLTHWVSAIERKMQAIIYGPPGTGKTFIAEKIGQHLIGGRNGFMELIQFHPSISYEDFIQGIRPQSDENDNLSYPLVKGRFLQFCVEASKRDGTCVLIIDEINRANLSSVFGELMYLLEYRDSSIYLAAGDKFFIPENVRIIGTMNTADRSIALVDHALRRRFAFLALYPDYDILKRFHADEASSFDPRGLITVLHNINTAIGDRNYYIGPSYFLRKDILTHIQSVWRMEIEPYLEEYFFDQPEKYETYTWEKVESDILI